MSCIITLQVYVFVGKVFIGSERLFSYVIKVSLCLAHSISSEHRTKSKQHNSHRSPAKATAPICTCALSVFLLPEEQTAACISVLRNALGFTAFSAFSMIINRKSGSVEGAYGSVSLESHYGLRFLCPPEQTDDRETKVVDC